MATDLNNLRIDHSQKGAPARKSHAPIWIGIVAAVLVVAAALVFFVHAAAPLDVQVARAAPVQTSATSGDKDDDVVLNATGYIVAAHKIELAPKVSVSLMVEIHLGRR